LIRWCEAIIDKQDIRMEFLGQDNGFLLARFQYGWYLGVLPLPEDSLWNEDAPKEDRQHMGTVQQA
jgi:hypothetical protein